VVIILDKLGTDGVSNVAVRGVTEDVLAFRPSVRVASGRARGRAATSAGGRGDSRALSGS
jgi:hypothetical protein